MFLEHLQDQWLGNPPDSDSLASEGHMEHYENYNSSWITAHEHTTFLKYLYSTYQPYVLK